MTTTTTCNNASLAVYVPSGGNPWNEQKVNHLFRRAAFGATRQMINNALSKTPAQVVDDLVDEALNVNPSPLPN